jgi:hypothetical protein
MHTVGWHAGSGKDSGCKAGWDSVKETTLSRPQVAGCGLDFWAKTTAVETTVVRRGVGNPIEDFFW